MAKHEAQETALGTPDAAGNFIFSKQDLIELLTAVQAKAAATSDASTATAEIIGNKLAEALLESRKPYIDPKVEENEEVFRESLRMIERKKQENTDAHQRQCPHIMGCNALSEMMHPSGLTCIAWHYNDLGETVGLCLNCGREFWQGQPDYARWRNKKSGCKISKAGQRELSNPLQARMIARQTARDITRKPEHDLELVEV